MLEIMITIVDSGVANTGSMVNMLNRIGADCRVTSIPDLIRSAEKLILPGVGSFDAGMNGLLRAGLIEALRDRVLNDGVPLLGVCLGMQMLTRKSEEGILPGLGLINAQTIRWKFDPASTGLKIPHMGWNSVTACNSSPLFQNMEEQPRFYFVHSYHVQCEDVDTIAATVNHGYEAVAAISERNILGVQFHPEKSHRFGKHLLENFCRWQPTGNFS